jgi:hypothetical protein
MSGKKKRAPSRASRSSRQREQNPRAKPRNASPKSQSAQAKARSARAKARSVGASSFPTVAPVRPIISAQVIERLMAASPARPNDGASAVIHRLKRSAPDYPSSPRPSR